MDCNSSMSKPNWRPTWNREDRDLAWHKGADRTNAQNPFGGEIYLWGNVPAFDILGLADYEGITYTENIELLFAD
jgi:hypothetical protein